MKKTITFVIEGEPKAIEAWIGDSSTDRPDGIISISVTNELVLKT